MLVRLALVALCAVLLFVPHGFGPEPRPAPQDPPSPLPAARIPGALKALRESAAQRAYPGRDLPRRGYADAFAAASSLPTAPHADKAAPTPWSSIGPHNIGGRTLALAFNPQDPQTLWAGSASGGLWRSRTAGVGVAAWQRVPTGHPVLGVGAIAITPGDSNVMYIGTGEVYSHDDTQGGLTDRLTRGSFGIGILKSLDAGATWFPVLDWAYAQERGVQAIRIDPTDPNVVWAGTTEGTYKTINGGLSWILVHDVVMVTDILIHGTNPDIVVVAAGNLGSPGTRVYRTTDGGVTWNVSLPNTVVASYKGKAMLGGCRDLPDVMYASVGNGGAGYNATWLVRSNDAGANWTVVTNKDYSLWQGWFAHDVAVHPSNPDLVVTAGVDIWRTTNGGPDLARKSDWTAWYFGQTPVGGPEGPSWYAHGDHHDIVRHPVDPDILYFAGDGGVFRSLNGGLSFEGCNGGYQTQQFYAGLAVSRQDPQLIMGGMQDNSTAIWTGSPAWTRVIGGDGSWAGIDAADNGTIYGSAQVLQMFRSRNGGAWIEVTPPEQGQTSFIAPFVLGGPDDPDVIYAARTFVFKSTDEGANWQTTNGGTFLEFNPVLSLAVSPTDVDVVYAATSPIHAPASVYRTLDGGASWLEVSAGLPDRYPVGLTVDPSDPLTVYVTFSGFGTGHVFRSTDAGGTWTDIGTSLPDVPTSAIAVDPLDPDHIYVGTDIGIFATASGGATWFTWGAGLPETVMCMDLEVSPVDRTLVLATHGSGMFKRPLLEPVTAVGDAPARPRDDLALRCAPNPFNPRTTVSWEMPAPGHARVEVLDVAGRRVRVLHDGSRDAGRQTAAWDGRDGHGRNVATGVYLVRVRAAGRDAVTRVQLVR